MVESDLEHHGYSVPQSPQTVRQALTANPPQGDAPCPDRYQLGQTPKLGGYGVPVIGGLNHTSGASAESSFAVYSGSPTCGRCRDASGGLEHMKMPIPRAFKSLGARMFARLRSSVSGLCTVMLLCHYFAVPVRADQLGDGEKAWGVGDFAQAIELLSPLAEKGDARAQFLVGLMYTVGDGVEKNIPQGIAWFLRSAEQGNVDAQYSLGQQYASKEANDTFHEDYVQSYVWLSLATQGYRALGKEQMQNSAAMKEIIARKLTPGQIRDADALVAEWQASH